MLSFDLEKFQHADLPGQVISWPQFLKGLVHSYRLFENIKCYKLKNYTKQMSGTSEATTMTIINNRTDLYHTLLTLISSLPICGYFIFEKIHYHSRK